MGTAKGQQNYNGEVTTVRQGNRTGDGLVTDNDTVVPWLERREGMGALGARVWWRQRRTGTVAMAMANATEMKGGKQKKKNETRTCLLYLENFRQCPYLR